MNHRSIIVLVLLKLLRAFWLALYAECLCIAEIQCSRVIYEPIQSFFEFSEQLLLWLMLHLRIDSQTSNSLKNIFTLASCATHHSKCFSLKSRVLANLDRTVDSH